MCGGSGPRLWPLSRASHPKQFLQLFSQNSLVRDTYRRFSKFIPAKNIFFVSHQKYLDDLQREFGKSVPSKNYISEPEKKNTAMAILYGATIINKINPNAVITASPSDHYIESLSHFKNDIQKAAKIALSTKNIVTIGINPTYPNPGFGYILPESQQHGYSPVSKFIEKPSTVDAQLLIKKDALWNSGIYTFTTTTIFREFAVHQQDYSPATAKLNSGSIKTAYSLSPNLAIDKAISEKSTHMVVVPATFGWSDIGEWNSIWQHLNHQNDGLVNLNHQSNYLSVNSKNCLIHGAKDKLIGLVGLNNLAIIDTPDCLLVCNLHDSFSVRDLVKKIVSDPKLKKYFLSKNDR